MGGAVSGADPRPKRSHPPLKVFLQPADQGLPGPSHLLKFYTSIRRRAESNSLKVSNRTGGTVWIALLLKAYEIE
jgi:hypothetical protein